MITQILLQQTIIMFLLMMLGLLLSRRGMITEQGSRDLSNVLLYAVSPCVILRSYMSEFSVDKLRAMGAFLVSAEKVAGQVRQVRILPEQGGTLRLAIPEGCKVASVTGNKGDKLEKEGVLILETEKDKTVTVQYN